MSLESLGSTYCINLTGHSERWQSFLNNCPFSNVERVEAINGNKCTPPPWWTIQKAAWGCLRTHLGIFEKCLNEGIKRVTIFEDDAIPRDNFATHWEQFCVEVPDDWQMIYLGGQLLGVAPVQIKEHVYRAVDVNRLHAYMVQNEMIEILYRHICEAKDWTSRHHVDHHIARLHPNVRVYIPHEWLFGQNAGASSINGYYHQKRFWNFSQKTY